MQLYYVPSVYDVPSHPLRQGNEFVRANEGNVEREKRARVVCCVAQNNYDLLQLLL